MLAGKGHYNQDLIAEKYLEWIESSPRDMPVLFGIALSPLRQQKRQKKGHNIKNLGSLLLKGSQKNKKQESALGLSRLVPLVLWGLKLE